MGKARSYCSGAPGAAVCLGLEKPLSPECPFREDKSTTKVGGSKAFLMNAILTSAAGTSPHQTQDLITECLLGCPVVPVTSPCPRPLLACGGSNSAVFLELKSATAIETRSNEDYHNHFWEDGVRVGGLMDSSRATKRQHHHPSPQVLEFPVPLGLL